MISPSSFLTVSMVFNAAIAICAGNSSLTPEGANLFDQFAQADDGISAGPALVAANDTGSDSAIDDSGELAATASSPITKADMIAAQYQGGPEQVDADILKIALMTQDMSMFGATAAAETERDRKYAITPVDYFAAG